MTLSDYDRISQAIDIYENSVNDAITSLKKNAVVAVIFITITLVFVISAIFWSNLGGLLTTLGLSGITVSSQGQTWIFTIKAYNNDSTTLKRSTSRIKQQFTLCQK